MLQRIYGTAWESGAQLQAYETMKVEAARRDHRKLGQELDLFSIQEGTGGWQHTGLVMLFCHSLLLPLASCCWRHTFFKNRSHVVA